MVPVGDVAAMVAAIEQLANDSELRESMGKESAAIGLERFDAKVAVAAWEDLFDQIADGTLAARP